MRTVSIIDSLTEWVLTKDTPYVLEIGNFEIKKAFGIADNSEISLKELQTVTSETALLIEKQPEILDLDTDKLNEILGKMFKKNFFREQYVSIILPDQLFYFNSFLVPAISAKVGIQPLLEREIQKSLPMPYKNYQTCFEFGPKIGNKTQIFACSLVKETINKIKTSCERYGLIPLSIQPSFVNMVKLAKTSQDEIRHPIVFTQINEDSITAGILNNKGLKQIQIIKTGINTLIQKLAQELNLSPTDAQQKLLNNLILLEDPTSETQFEIDEYRVLEPIFADILKKIYGFLLVYSNDHPEENGFAKIIISGKGAQIKNIEKLINANLGISTSKISDEISIPFNQSYSQKNSSLEYLAPIVGSFILKPWSYDSYERTIAA